MSKPAVCAEYALPFVKKGGLAVLYRGHWSEEDTESLAAAAEQLGSRIELIHPWVLPLVMVVRHCIYLRKHLPTPKKYPAP